MLSQLKMILNYVQLQHVIGGRFDPASPSLPLLPLKTLSSPGEQLYTSSRFLQRLFHGWPKTVGLIVFPVLYPIQMMSGFLRWRTWSIFFFYCSSPLWLECWSSIWDLPKSRSHIARKPGLYSLGARGCLGLSKKSRGMSTGETESEFGNRRLNSQVYIFGTYIYIYLKQDLTLEARLASNLW